MGWDEKQRKNEILGLFAAATKVIPPCPHVADGCGGCLLQEYDYADQARVKAQYLSSIYDRTVSLVPCEAPLGYRSRMDYVVAFGKMGLRVRARYAYVVDVDDCFLLPMTARQIYLQAREFLMSSGLEPYNYIRHEGFLCYLVVRHSVATGQTMLIVTTKRTDDATHIVHVKELLEKLRASTGVESVHWTMNDRKADLSVGEPFWHCGEPFIIDEIAKNRFYITPQTFFQGNPTLASDLFKHAMSYVRGNLLDLYSGVGVLAMLAAQQDTVSRVVGVELNAHSIAAAKENLLLNNFTSGKCEFICDDATAYYANTTDTFETVICDPARAGLGKPLCLLLVNKMPSRIIYISCNPLSHIEDLAILSRAYNIVELKGYDLFPQTPHLEVLSVLDRKYNID